MAALFAPKPVQNAWATQAKGHHNGSNPGVLHQRLVFLTYRSSEFFAGILTSFNF